MMEPYGRVPEFQPFAEDKTGGASRLTLMVEGVHCAACIQKIESALMKDPDVLQARLNFSTKRLTIDWRGPAQLAERMAHIVREQGYKVQPYDPKAVQAESDEEGRFLQICLGVSAFATFNTMLIAEALWTSSAEQMGQGTRDLLHWVSALIAIPATLYAGQPFFRMALMALKVGKANMDVPISIGVVGALAVSLWQVVNHGHDVYFDSAISLVFFLLIGRYLDFRARRKARSAASDLLAMMSGTAIVIDEKTGQKTTIPIRDVREGMIVFVAMGQRVPADAQVVDGQSDIDTSLVTGETLPRLVTIGSAVYAGTINLSAPLTLAVTAASKDSLLSDIVRLMEKAEQGQAKYVRLADRVAKFYTPAVHMLAAVTLLGWWIFGQTDFSNAVLIAVTVLIITCPCALGLAVPVVQVLATGRLMKNNVLVKSGDALERLATIDTVLFDKTGTLTIGKPQIHTLNDVQNHYLPLAASLASHSHHPLSKSLAAAWSGDVVSFDGVEEIPGKGLQTQKDGQTLCLGSRAWCGDPAAPVSTNQEIWLAVNGAPVVMYTFSDALRPDAAAVITHLKSIGLTPILLSGDRMAVAQAVGADVGIETALGDLSPIDKYNYMEDLRSKGHKGLMVGDGLNDAPTLVGADVSISPSSAIDMAQNAADIVFMGDQLGAIIQAYRTAIFAQKLVKENLWLALVYNIIAVPVAVAGLATPLVAAIAMSSSSLVVIGNSFRLSLMQKVRP
jgi:Cu2+-exporting ATPase